MACRLSLTILLLLLCLHSPSVIPAEEPGAEQQRQLNPEETQQTLVFLSKQLTTNLDAIHTWQGTYLYRSESLYHRSRLEPPSWKTTYRLHPFWLDQRQDKLHVSNYVIEKPDELNQLQPIPAKIESSLNAQWIVVKGEESLELSEKRFGSLYGFPETVQRQVGWGRVLFRKWNFEIERDGRFFDPRKKVLGTASGSFARTPEMYAKVLSGAEGKEKQETFSRRVTITEKKLKDGQKQLIVKIEYNRAKPNGLPEFRQMTYDSRFGYSPVKYESLHGTVPDRIQTFSYKNVNGIYLPQKVIFEDFQFRLVGKRELTSRRTYTLLDSKLNQPINPDQFQIKSFNLQYGERMLDRTKNKAFIQDQDGLVPAEEFEFNKESQSKN
ncbi:hypothetical protein [Gimesia sp.]|uniref:hypothetical protein n=1 Tax=Gimesia sp. TaxID=2024833 RepID=UPI000C6AF407|nr:hypothetical protein [Gimesia sp.]MAX35896.1 hypothetical protein [Gimesia sp.]HAH47047.1 hypothetical protein [Planctomycetaceae bacterium]HBL44506.1 hypothetical protein [Planctomycetaceae bacterium]|tara:strand:- start:958 stop:2103 length:1146 start_codon:yes stop_codon:yes gene_type:complete